MSIAMDRFASKGLFLSFEPVVSTLPRASMYYVQCRSCGFEPEMIGGRPPRLCPKCSSQGWERFTRPGSLLADADRFES